MNLETRSRRTDAVERPEPDRIVEGHHVGRDLLPTGAVGEALQHYALALAEEPVEAVLRWQILIAVRPPAGACRSPAATPWSFAAEPMWKPSFASWSQALSKRCHWVSVIGPE